MVRRHLSHSQFSVSSFQSPRDEREERMVVVRGELDQELEAITKYEQEPEFRSFVKNLLRCRSLASLDSNERRTEEVEVPRRMNDDIERPDQKKRSLQNMVRERREVEERSGRGEDRVRGSVLK